ncbi:hypothetical protein Tco_0876766 [Tanacetum coccineum]|uniref:Uncharacterized protein n=1 Tax=Tanacetum coccineum TaxID=301880 RepID=A0ABQ5BT67_9ASTR
MPTDPHHIPTIIPPSTSQPQRKQRPRKLKRKDTEIPQSSVPVENVADEAVYKERDGSLERATTTAIGLDAEHDRGGGPRCQDTMGDTIAQTRSENVSKFSNDLLLTGVNTPRSGEDSMQLKELMDFCTKLQQRVLGLENTKTAQAQEITSLKKRITHKLKRLCRVGRFAKVVSSEEASVLNDEKAFAGHDMAEKEVSTADPVTTAGEVVTIANVEVSTASPTAAAITNVELTLAQTLTELKSARPKTKGVVMQEPSESITTTTTIPSKDKGKGLMVEEPLKMMKKDQISFDEQEAIRLQAEFDEEVRLAREKDEANVALIEEWNDIQAKIEVDQLLAERLQAKEQEELTIKEKSKLFQQLLEKRRKHFAAKRAEERRNRPPTKAQQRKLFDKAIKMVNTFVDMDTELMEDNEIREKSSSKRAGDGLEQEPSKKQKVDDDKEIEELKQCMEIISDDGDDVTIEAIPLFVKMPIINFKARFKKTEPVNYMDIFLHLNKKTMFEHHLEYSVWKNQQGLVKVLNWKLYDSCGVHCVTMQNILYYLLVEKMYPLTKHTLHQMFNDVKLQVDYECEIAFELLRLVKKQLKEGYVPQ